MYTPPICGNAKFYLGEIRPHACADIVFRLSDTFTNAVIISDALSIASNIAEHTISFVISKYNENADIHNSLDEVVIKSQDAYIYSELLQVVVNNVDAGIGDGPLFPPSSVKDIGTNISWELSDDSDKQFNFSFNDLDPNDVSKNIKYNSAEAQDKTINHSWELFFESDNKTNISWNLFNNLSDVLFNHSWIGLLSFKDVEKRIPWKTPDFVQVQKNISYEYPLSKDNQKLISWEGSCKNLLSTQIGVAFTLKTPFKDNQKTVRWGPRDLTWIPCEPGSPFDKPRCNQNRFRLDEDMTELTGVCEDITMVLQCDNRVYNPYHYFHTGNRDSFWVKPLEPVIGPVYGENFYIVENTILVKRISDNTPIDVIEVICRIDKGSWLWDFSITVTEKDSLDLLKPYKSGDDTIFHDIEISMNQNLWACRIEKWSENRSFGQESWTLTGRSPSSELTEPFSIPESFLSGTARQGGDMIEAILNETGWEVQWGYNDNSSTYSEYMNPFTDWLIPVDGYSYSDLVKIKGIQDIVQGIGGFIQTKADCHLTDSQKLIINPNYVRDPWLWDTETPDVEIPESLCKEISRNFESYKRIDAVIVSGIDHGVITNATRMGLAGTTYGSMITHSLITTQEVGAERARSELAKTGMWSNHTLNLFSLKVPGSAVDPMTRLILPGELAQVTENGTTWKGQSSGTTVTGTVSEDGVKDVMQTITVEEYIG